MHDQSESADDGRKTRGRLVGITLGILGTVGSYFALRADPYGSSLYIWLWLSPLGLGVVLACVPRFRQIGLGIAAGVALSWLVGVPACVAVTLETVPVLG